MKTILFATLVAASFGAPSAFAQSTYVHHEFCLKQDQGGSLECAYNSMAQCEAARKAGTATCTRNTGPQNH